MNQEYFERCENYLLDKMSTEERSDFENELKQNVELKREFEIAQAIHASAELSVRAKLKDELEGIHQKHFDQIENETIKEEPRRNLFIGIAIGLIAVLLIWAAAKIITQKETMPETIYAQNFTPPDLDLTYRGSSVDRLFQMLESSYEEGDYKKFVDYVEGKDSLLNANPRLMLASGVAQMEMGKGKEAREHFKKLMENAIYRDQANWYIGLSYLKENDTENARRFLEIISKSSNRYRDQSIQILKKI